MAAQPCDQPTRRFGVGVVVGDGLVATAAHTVEDDLRRLTVDDEPAVLVAIDPRTDLALLVPSADVGAAVRYAPAPDELPAPAVVVGPDGAIDVEVVRTGDLVVDDTTAGRRWTRRTHRFRGEVAGGTSGAPLLDLDGRLLGIVVLTMRARDESYAVSVDELEALLATVDGGAGGGPLSPSGGLC